MFVEGLADSCSLDVADRVAGAGLSSEEVAALRGRTRQWSDSVLSFTMVQLRANATEDPLAAKILRSNSRTCVICGARGIGWIPLCHKHGVSFATGPDARSALTGKVKLVDALAKFVQKRRKTPLATEPEDPEELDPESY